MHAGRVAIESPIDWTRSIENQLDWAHLPFVHRTTIGAGARPAVEVGSRLEGERLDTWLIDPAHREDPPGLKISLLFPNVWINPFGGRWQTGMIAFAPIEPGRTRLYVRTYQRRLPIPGLARLLSRLTNLLNRVIVAQDVRVVRTQPQRSTHDLKDERLVQSDLPIAQFRKHLRAAVTRRLPVIAA